MVISWKINRLSRKLADAIKIVELLEQNGITYRSYSEPFESDTPAGKMQFQMMALIGEFERSTIAQNVKMGMCAKARAGEWCGGIAPLGYDWCQINEEEKSIRKKSKLVVNKKEAEIVKTIFELYASGKGYKAIVNDINKRGYRTKQGNYFSVGPLRDILINPVYIGKVRFNVRRDWNDKRRNNKNPNPIIEDGIHEAIISDELWKKVQFIMSQKQGKPSRIYDGEYPLTGILKCPECGAGMVISRTTNTLKDGTKRRIVYYACGAWKNKGTAVCHSNMIRVENANKVVYKELEKIFSNEKFLQGVIKKVNAESAKQHETVHKNIEKCEKEYQQLKLRKDKIFKAYEENLITSEELIERKNAINIEIEQVKGRMEEASYILETGNHTELSYEFVKEVLHNFSHILNSGIERELRKQLLHMVISEITINDKREINSIKITLTNEMLEFIQQQNGGALTKGAPLNFSQYRGKWSFIELELVV